MQKSILCELWCSTSIIARIERFFIPETWAFLRNNTELVMLQKSLVSDDHFSRYRSSKKVILGRHVGSNIEDPI